VGLVPLVATPGDAFDAQRHQLAEGETATSAPIGEVVACGYSFQGKPVRPVLVKLQTTEPEAVIAAMAESITGQSHLPLGTESPVA
jgi:hypothetical protein